MNKLLLLFPVALFTMLTGNTQAQTPVWSTDIAPILYNNCAGCHRPSGIGPFELITYNDAVNKSVSIVSAVKTKYMPPWPPDPHFNRLAHERLLSQADIDKITAWVAGGAQQGDPNLAPPPPVFNPNGDLPGTPDLVVQIPTFTSTANTYDVYQCFVLPSGTAAEKFITAFEAVPGNRDIVHHVLVYSDTTGKCAQLDAQTPGPGYVNFGGVGHDDVTLLGGWVPGTQPTTMPNGFGIRLPKNADIVVQVHYPAGSVNKVDSTEIHFFFSSSPSLREVRIDPVLNHQGVLCNINPPGALYIPANQTKAYSQTSNVSSFVGDISLIGVAPHMHLIGRSINCYGTKNGDTIKIIDIPSWDFSWQGFYTFRKIIKLPAGTTLHSDAFYDNTAGNPFNPSNPPKDVHVGEATTDEMMLTFLVWAYYQTGDEDSVIDDSPLVPLSVDPSQVYSKQELFAPYPNPTTNQLYVKYQLQAADKISISITDLQGRVIKELEHGIQATKGYHVQPYNVSDIPAGMYILQVRTTEQVLTEKISIQH